MPEPHQLAPLTAAKQWRNGAFSGLPNVLFYPKARNIWMWMLTHFLIPVQMSSHF